MKTQTEREFEDFEGLSDSKLEELPTPNYDAKSNEVKKYFAIGTAKYIEELGEALRKDWARDVSMEYWKDGEKSNRARRLMRDKLVEDWSSEQGNITPWTDQTIINNLPDFLKFPKALEYGRSEAGQVRAERMRQASAEKYKQKVQNEMKTIGKIVTQSVEPPKEKPIEPGYTDDDDTSYRSYGGGSYQRSEDDQAPSPREFFEDIIHGLGDAWRGLTNTHRLPGVAEDVLVDFIKPSDKHRLRILKGLDEADAAHFANVLAWTDMVIRRTLVAYNEMQKEPGKRIAIK